jgi:acetyl-CoA carboxylase biotin carboxyl carrier protein
VQEVRGWATERPGKAGTDVGLSPEEVRALVVAFEESDWTEMTLTTGGTTLELSRTGAPPRPPADAATPAGPPVTPPAPAAPAPSAPAPSTSAPSTPGPSPAAPVASPPGEARPHDHTVTSPTVGLFWRSPQPDAPPFTDVGAVVAADDTVCIVEVMKLMNHVKAGVAGVVRAVRAQNGEMVEHGQTLFEIEPGGS